MDSERRCGVVIDPYPLWLDALGLVLAWTGIDVVGRARAGAEAVRLVERHRPDLLVGEIHALGGGLEGEAFVRRAREAYPELRTVVVSATEDDDRVGAALAAGASAYVPKTARGAELALVLRRVCDEAPPLPVRRDGQPAADGESSPDLTKRELEILRLVAEGHSNAQLARMLWVTEQTVKFHLSNIYRKLEVTNRTEASRWAQVHNLLPPKPAGRAAPVP